MTGPASAPRKVTEVAVGVLLRPDNAVLLADRPAGKPYAGYWEFPGGKIEPGESVEHALARELHEELGIDVGLALPWVTFEFDYPHAYVRLHFCRVYRWHGTPHGREGQRLTFFRLGQDRLGPLLPAAVPALRWLDLPTIVAEAAVDVDTGETLLARVDAALAQGLRLLLLRSAAAPESCAGASLAALVASVRARTQAHSARLILDRDLVPSCAGRSDGIQLDERALLQATGRPEADWLGAEVGSRASLERAAQLGCDYALPPPVLPGYEVLAAGTPLGWHGFGAFARCAPLPVIARGGLGTDDLGRAMQSGAHGLMLPLDAWLDRRRIAR